MTTYQIPEQLLARCAGQAQICKRVVHKFVLQMQADITQLSQLVEEGDSDQVSKLAHRIKGAASNVVADEIATAAAEIEFLAAEGRIDEAKPHVDHIKLLWSEYESLTEAFLFHN